MRWRRRVLFCGKQKKRARIYSAACLNDERLDICTLAGPSVYRLAHLLINAPLVPSSKRFVPLNEMSGRGWREWRRREGARGGGVDEVARRGDILLLLCSLGVPQSICSRQKNSKILFVCVREREREINRYIVR